MRAFDDFGWDGRGGSFSDECCNCEKNIKGRQVSFIYGDSWKYACDRMCKAMYLDGRSERTNHNPDHSRLSVIGVPCQECCLGTDGIYRFCCTEHAESHRFTRVDVSSLLSSAPAKKKAVKRVVVPTAEEAVKHDMDAAEDAEDGATCMNCLVKRPNCIVMPCRHMCLCCGCARLLGKNGDATRGTVKCISCQSTNVKSIQRVFL
jgi:hypothetical protein